MKLKPRYFVYNDQYGKWTELSHEPSAHELSQYRDSMIAYDAYQVERALGHYRSFFEEVGKHLTSLPEWFQKFYFDMKRRIEHEYKTRDTSKVPENPNPTCDGKD